MRRAWVIVAVLLLAGCWGEQEAPSPPPPSVEPETTQEAAPPPSPTPDAKPSASKDTIRSVVQLRDLAGNPLAGMGAIATESPNAFDAPVAKSTETNEAGEGHIILPAGRELYVRGWDPDLKYFANNFYNVLKGDGSQTQTLVLTMVEASEAVAQLETPDGAPLVNMAVQVMLSHPTQGPWWPSRGETNSAGLLTLSPLPPGQFNLELRTKTAGSLELPATVLPPGETAVLGKLTLRPPS
jgi:hypothetical protein